MQPSFSSNDFENRTRQNVFRTFAGQYMPPNPFPNLNFTKCVSKTIRTNPTFPLLKSTIAPQLSDWKRVFIYIYVKNGCKQADMRRRRMELASVPVLPAVPKAWRVTLALTQLPAVEPLRWGLRGIGGSAIVLDSFFNIIFGSLMRP
jgi:hypothetical protein